MVKKNLHNLIAEGKLKAALQLMRQLSDTQNSYFSDPLIGVLSRFNRNENAKYEGTISTENYNIEFNKIEASAKNLLENEFDESLVPADFQMPEVAPPPVVPPAIPDPTTTPTGAKQVTIFISYSQKDADLREELVVHLASVRRRNKMSNWEDRHINSAGELWKDDIVKAKIKQADIILFLVSPSFIATDAVWDYEIPLAVEQRNAGKAKVIPIIIRPCDWSQLDLADYKALPFSGKPVSEYPSRDVAWLEVVNAVEAVINSVQK